MKTLICPNCYTPLDFPEDQSEAGFLWDPSEPSVFCEECDTFIYEDEAVDEGLNESEANDHE